MARRNTESASATLQRQWQMLRLVPRQPRKIAAREIHNLLANIGLPTTKRTIERDLIALSASFQLVVDDRNKPYGWSWSRDAPSLDLPRLTLDEGLAFHLVEQFLKPLLPAQVAERLQPYFRNARQVLDSVSGPGHAKWAEKVRVVPPGQPLLVPKMAAGVFEAVSTALMHARQLDLRHQPRGEKTPRELRIHPLGLVQRGAILYLVCTVFDYSDVRLLAMHRIKSATESDTAANIPKQFDLDAHIAGGAFGFTDEIGRKIRLTAIFRERAGNHLYETPLAADQRLTEIEPGTLRLAATVPDTAQLRWWLLGFGDRVEVLRPKSLRSEFATMAKAMAARYR
jgi:predicted DNA-binding transcriptional regulator YafY